MSTKPQGPSRGEATLTCAVFGMIVAWVLLLVYWAIETTAGWPQLHPLVIFGAIALSVGSFALLGALGIADWIEGRNR